MKTKKEYPATHSVDTNWYAIDSKGEVAIMNCIEDAVVACQYNEQESFYDFINLYAKKLTNNLYAFELPEKQIEQIEKYFSYKSSDFIDQIFDGLADCCFIKFSDTYKWSDYNNLWTAILISEEKNIYYILEITDDEKLNIIIDKLIKSRDILGQFYADDIDLSDHVFSECFGFFEYEGNSSEYGLRHLYTPSHLLNIYDCHNINTDKIPKLPIQFSHSDRIYAQFYNPCLEYCDRPNEYRKQLSKLITEQELIEALFRYIKSSNPEPVAIILSNYNIKANVKNSNGITALEFAKEYAISKKGKRILAMLNNIFLEKAIEIAKEAHSGQVDKGGKPYIDHSIRVMDKGITLDEKIVGVLHDVIENSKWTFDMLECNGFNDEIIKALQCLTKNKDENYNLYIKRVSMNNLAIKVKLYDLIDNMNEKRLPSINEKDNIRLEKYKLAYNELLTYLPQTDMYWDL